MQRVFHLSSINKYKTLETYNREKTAFSINGWANGKRICKKNQVGLLPHTIYKNKLKTD